MQRHVAAVPERDRRAIAGAVHVLDRFHVMQQFGKALDEIRAEEPRQLKRDGYEPVLKHSRWCLLKRPENLTVKQTVKLSELVQVQPAERAGVPAAGRLSTVLGVRQSDAGPASSWTNGRSG